MSFDKAKYNKNLNTLFANSPKTARQIADDLDMTEATISRYRTGGRIPAFPVAVKIAEYFGVSVEWLAGADGYEIDSFNQMPASLRKMLSLYESASDADRRIVDLILSKYDTADTSGDKSEE